MMRLINRLRNITKRKKAEIETLYPLPFKIKMYIMYCSDGLSDSQISLLTEVGYNFIGDAYSKGYGWSRYPKSILEEFLTDMSDIYIPWDKGHVNIKLVPKNISVGRDSKFIRSIFYSTNTVLPLLSPFWAYRWVETHNSFKTMVNENAGEDLITTIEQTNGYVVDLRSNPEEGYEIIIRNLYNHPSMILSGISIIQSIMARAFYNSQLREVSKIFINNTTSKRIWVDMRTTDLIVDFMKEYYRVHFVEYSIPGLENIQYNNINKAFIDILREYTRNTGSFKDRCSKLSLSFWRDGNTEHRPVNNEAALYNVLEDEFSWSRGPEVR